MAERAKFEKYTIAFTVFVLLGCVLLVMKFQGCGPWAPAKAMDTPEE